MEAVSAASSIVALMHITIKVAVLSYEYIDKATNAPFLIQRLVSELKMLTGILKDLEKDAQDPESTVLQRLESPIQNYVQEITMRHGKLESKRPTGRQSWWNKLRWPLKEAETLQFLLEIERFKTNLLLAMSSDQSRGMKMIRERGHKEDIRRNDSERVEVLDWLFPGSFNERHNEISSRRKKRTGQWILDAPEVQDWKKPGNHGLLWGYGIPGAGKTFLSSLMIDSLQAQAGCGVAHIYFNYKEQDKQKPTHVLSSLIKQLISQTSAHPLPQKLESFYKGQKTPNSGELYGILLDVIELFTRTFFIFDALDECDQNSQRKELLPLFHRMGNDGMNLFLTSREHPEDVQISFARIAKLKLWAKDDDVASYIEQKIPEYPRAESLISQGNYRDKIISELMDCAKGMFLLVHFHIECICQQTTTKQILMELERIKTSSGSSINKSLSPTYDRAMGILFAQHPPSRVELAIRVLSWLVKARKVLTIHQLQEAVTVDEGCSSIFEESDLPHMQTMIDVCAGLVNFDKDSNTVRLVHYTAQEYLLTHPIILENANFKVAKACIAYLLGGVMTTLTRANYAYNLTTPLPPLLEYLHVDWRFIFHLNECEESLSEDLTMEFVLLLSRRSDYVEYLLHPQRRSRFFEPTRTPNLSSPLQVACLLGHLSVAQKLQKTNSGIPTTNTGQHEGVGLSQILSWKGCWECWRGYQSKKIVPIVRLMIENGANSSMRGYNGTTALHIAAEYGCTEAIEPLLFGGADLSVTDNEGMTALHLAICYRHTEAMNLLLSKGADLSVTDNEGMTALHLAAYYGYTESVELLLSKGADLSVTDNKGMTALHLAICYRHTEAMNLLLSKGADLSVTDNKGMTALHLAIRYGHTEAVELLLSKGAYPSVTDNGRILVARYEHTKRRISYSLKAKQGTQEIRS